MGSSGEELLIGTGFLTGWWKCAKINCGDGYTILNILKTNEPYTSNGWTVLYMNYISIMPLKQNEGSIGYHITQLRWSHLCYVLRVCDLSGMQDLPNESRAYTLKGSSLAK